MGIVSVSLPSDGQTIDAVDYNVPINTILSTINGNIDADNIKNGSITQSKIDMTQKYTWSVVGTVASGATITPVTTVDMYTVTALTDNTTIAAPSGSAIDGQTLVIRITDGGTAKTIAWNATYTPIGVTLPTSSAGSATKAYYVGCKYNNQLSRWDVLAVARQA